MKRAILVLGLVIALFSTGFGQEAGNKGRVIIKGGTELSLRLQTDVNAKKATVPMDITLRTAEAVEGLGKNTEVYGRVVRAEKTSKENDTSRIGLLFDFVKRGEKFLTLSAAVIEVVDKNGEGIEFAESPTFQGGTVLSLKGKDINLPEGTIIRIKLKEDLTEN